MTLYLLWDIDGTLLSTARAGVFALEDAAAQVLGVDGLDLQAMPTAGLTDAQIARRVLEGHRPDVGDADVRAFLGAYAAALPERLPLRRGKVLDGVHDVLEALHARDDVVNVLLTGNVEPGAWAKLEHYGIRRFFDDGAFCVEDHDRADIARRALELVASHAGAQRAGDPTWVAEHVIVIGDTPHDVAGATAIGARCLAVATGGHTAAELQATGAWRIVESLPDPDAFLALVGLSAART